MPSIVSILPRHNSLKQSPTIPSPLRNTTHGQPIARGGVNGPSPQQDFFAALKLALQERTHWQIVASSLLPAGAETGGKHCDVVAHSGCTVDKPS